MNDNFITKPRIDYYGDHFFIVGFQIPIPNNRDDARIYLDPMSIRNISKTTTTKVFCTPGISLN